MLNNFINNNEETLKWIKHCFDFEDKLLASKKINSDFVYAVYKNNI